MAEQGKAEPSARLTLFKLGGNRATVGLLPLGIIIIFMAQGQHYRAHAQTPAMLPRPRIYNPNMAPGC